MPLRGSTPLTAALRSERLHLFVRQQGDARGDLVPVAIERDCELDLQSCLQFGTQRRLPVMSAGIEMGEQQRRVRENGHRGKFRTAVDRYPEQALFLVPPGGVVYRRDIDLFVGVCHLASDWNVGGWIRARRGLGSPAD